MLQSNTTPTRLQVDRAERQRRKEANELKRAEEIRLNKKMEAEERAEQRRLEELEKKA